MRYRLVAVGRLRSRETRALCDEYRRRLRRYVQLEEREVRVPERVLPAVPERARLVALSRRGQQWSSDTLAQWTARWERDGREVVLAIGGADTLPAAVLERADQVWSLSRLTLPHELARVVVYEQLYRAYTIRRGEPYHRGT